MSGFLGIGCLVLVLTWGFQLEAYGRRQAITGLESEARCQMIRNLIRERNPDWWVGVCVPDGPERP